MPTRNIVSLLLLIATAVAAMPTTPLLGKQSHGSAASSIEQASQDLRSLRRAAAQQASTQPAQQNNRNQTSPSVGKTTPAQAHTTTKVPEAVKFFALQIALLAVVLILHTYLGLHIIRRVLIFSDLVLDQLAAFGALVGIVLGVRYGSVGSYLISFVAVLFGSLMLAVVKSNNRLIPREALIGIMYALALVASLLVGDKLAAGNAYVTKTLTGSMLWVSGPIVTVTAGVYLALALFHYKFRSKFIALAENDRNLRNEAFWDFQFFATQGIITVLIVPIAGVLLAYAFLMIPAAIAAMFTKGWGKGLMLGWSIGFVACLIGLTGSYYLNLPYGPSLVLSLGSFFIVAVLVRASLAARART